MDYRTLIFAQSTCIAALIRNVTLIRSTLITEYAR